MFLVREYGSSKVATPPTSQEQFLEFLAHVHDGWKEAQKRIAVFLADALARRNEAQTSEKEQHRLNNKEGQNQARAVTKQINLEIVVARRMCWNSIRTLTRLARHTDTNLCYHKS